MSDEECEETRCARRWAAQVYSVERIELEGEWLPTRDGAEVVRMPGVSAREAAERVGEAMQTMRRHATESYAALHQVSETASGDPEVPDAWPVAGIDYHVNDEAAFMRNPLRYNPLISLKTMWYPETCTCVDKHAMSWDFTRPIAAEVACWRCRDGFGNTCQDCAVQLERERKWIITKTTREGREGEHDE